MSAVAQMSTGACATHEYARQFRHDDGWGAAAVLDSHDTVAVFRGAMPISQSTVAGSLDRLTCRALVVHARAASKPAQRGLVFAHPIEATIGDERVWFFHNGFCPTVHELIGLSESRWDSEELLGWLLPAFSATDWRRALRQRLARLRAGTANCVFLFSQRLIVCNWIDVTVGANQYYTMHAHVTSRSVIVASEPAPALVGPWIPLGHGRILECRVNVDGAVVSED